MFTLETCSNAHIYQVGNTDCEIVIQSEALFEHQKEYFDVNVVHEVRNDTYKRLSKLAGSVGLDESKVFELLEISDKPGEDGSLNIGNKVTDDVKLMVKVRLFVWTWGKQVPDDLANRPIGE